MLQILHWIWVRIVFSKISLVIQQAAQPDVIIGRIYLGRALIYVANCLLPRRILAGSANEVVLTPNEKRRGHAYIVSFNLIQPHVLKRKVQCVRGEIAEEHSQDQYGVFDLTVNLETLVHAKGETDDKTYGQTNFRWLSERQADPEWAEQQVKY